MSGNQKVSVVLPIFNGERYLIETLESIRLQTYRPIELIIVNDGSSDGSRTLCLEWVAKHDEDLKIQFFDNFLNLGVCSALGRACEYATGDFIAQIGHDDVWAPTHLAQLVSSLNGTSNAVAAFGSVNYINGSGEAIKANMFDHGLVDELSRYQLFARLLSGNVLCAPASLFRVKSYKKSFWGINNERLQDHRLWLNLLLEGDFIFVKDSEISYRVHENNLSSAHVLQLQGQLEFFEVHHSALFSDRLAQILLDLRQDHLVFEDFVRRIYQSVLSVEAYFPPVTLILMAWLEKVQGLCPCPFVVGLRANLLCSLGAIRKSLLISKSYMGVEACAKRGAPCLVPATLETSPKLFQFLVESGWFQDGRGISVGDGQNSDVFLLAAAADVQILSKQEYFRNLSKRKRVLLTAQQDDVSVGDECKIPIAKEKIGHAQLDRIFRYIEAVKALD
jgi:glycosyltransferase involved in cell wall biosynthesis